MSHSFKEDLENKAHLESILKERILVIDGATGTMLENLAPTADDFGGEKFFGSNEKLNMHAPHIPKEVHRRYIEAGAVVIETNSFNGSEIVMEEYDIPEQAEELARLSAEIANQAIKEYANGRKVFVMGSMGPGTKSISVTGGVDFDKIRKVYHSYARGLLKGGADILLLETVQDTVNLKACLLGIADAQNELGRNAPVSVSVTIEMGGTMLAGQNIEALYHTVSNFDIFSIGLNCATGPATMTDHLRTLASLSRFYVSVWPNAGLPDHEGRYSDSPDMFREIIGRFAREGFINIVGGCCGTTPQHIKAIIEATKDVKPRIPVSNGKYPAMTGAESMVVENDNRPVYIGERTNTIGSRKFKKLIGSEKWDEAAEIGRSQVKKGAMVIDVCTADPDREEITDFISLLKPLLRRVRVPILIDTTDSEVVEEALKHINGKPAINSVNLEDGGERLRTVAKIAKEYGASLICGLIDDDANQGMAVTVERKLEVAEKIYRILKDEFDFPDTDIIFDPLVFPAGTGDPAYLGSAHHTIDGTKAVKEKFPNCLTVLGISNVSFGLPSAGREVLNSVFLYLCAKAGLDMAIVNTEGLKRYPTISEDDRELAQELLLKGDQESIAKFSARWREVKVVSDENEWKKLPVEEQVSRAVVEARKEGLEKNLAELLSRMSPLEVINGPLLSGMDEVGRLFGDNSLIVAEVLESAEVMKAAVDFIKPYFPPGQSSNVKGKMLLATVKGDVHDIGKNLVDMILSNNGFEVINLGIKVPPEVLIEAVREHNPDFIGLSGLLVRSAQQMVFTADDLSAAGIDIPLIVGGAALTKKFTLTKIAPAYKGTTLYAAEAMEGLNLANVLVSKEKRNDLLQVWQRQSEVALGEQVDSSKTVIEVNDNHHSPRWIETDVPNPPDLKEHILTDIPVKMLMPYINEQMLYGKHLGVKRVKTRLNDPSDERIVKLKEQVMAVAEWASKEKILQPQAIYKWAKAIPESGLIRVFDKDDKQTSFKFLRQVGRAGISAIDWVRPPNLGGDHVGMFVCVSGKETTQIAEGMRKEGRLLESLILQSLAIELAEATAEYIHLRMRNEWGIFDDRGLSIQEMFRTKYRGIRLSFGYPACPDLSDQQGIFDILQPERIGVILTEEMMMHPEGAVSALVFHHPKGEYYAL